MHKSIRFFRISYILIGKWNFLFLIEFFTFTDNDKDNDKQIRFKKTFFQIQRIIGRKYFTQV